MVLSLYDLLKEEEDFLDENFKLALSAIKKESRTYFFQSNKEVNSEHAIDEVEEYLITLSKTPETFVSSHKLGITSDSFREFVLQIYLRYFSNVILESSSKIKNLREPVKIECNEEYNTWISLIEDMSESYSYLIKKVSIMNKIEEPYLTIFKGITRHNLTEKVEDPALEPIKKRTQEKIKTLVKQLISSSFQQNLSELFKKLHQYSADNSCNSSRVWELCEIWSGILGRGVKCSENNERRTAGNSLEELKKYVHL